MTPETTVRVAASGIHGLGLFAARPVRAGELLCEFLGDIITRDEARRRAATRPADAPVCIVNLDAEHDLDGDLPDNLAKYANHGCVANAELTPGEHPHRLFIIATADIPNGGEILYDYGFGLAESLGHPCRCGAPECPGLIVAEPLRPLLKKTLRRHTAKR